MHFNVMHLGKIDSCKFPPPQKKLFLFYCNWNGTLRENVWQCRDKLSQRPFSRSKQANAWIQRTTFEWLVCWHKYIFMHVLLPGRLLAFLWRRNFSFTGNCVEQFAITACIWLILRSSKCRCAQHSHDESRLQQLVAHGSLFKITWRIFVVWKRHCGWVDWLGVLPRQLLLLPVLSWILAAVGPDVGRPVTQEFYKCCLANA